jgi:wyosine [tRNA(Phe)-imidazoG37] synthetase (radical SAM superfamily)
MIAFGPVPSRRLGRSMGINNIPAKVCTYSCAYCQVGRTLDVQVERREFYDPRKILGEARQKVGEAQDAGERIDYITFVPDGEPTLDAHLAREIELLRPLAPKVAVITNASLISRKDVREDLMRADWVSLKVDSVSEAVWRRINRGHRSLQLGSILDGMLAFAEGFGGELATETMLVRGVNDDAACVEQIAAFLNRLNPTSAYLSIPTRPPAEPSVRAPGEETINRAYQVLSGAVRRVEYLIGYEGNAFAFTGDAEEDLLSITAVHPMREEAVRNFLRRAGADWSVIDELVRDGGLVETEYEGRKFYVRRFGRRRSDATEGATA